MSSNYKQAVAKIYAVVVLSIVLVTLILYLFGVLPLYRQLQLESTKDINGFLNNHALSLENILEHYSSLTQQVASRTAIRKKQILYNNGKITLHQLVSFSKPKLADALKPNGEIIGIMRFDPAGKLLYQVGKSIREEELTIQLYTVSSTQFTGPFESKNGPSYLLYYSTIIDSKHGIVGYDVLLLDDREIRTIINKKYYSYGNLFISNKRDFVYLPQHFEDEAVNGKTFEEIQGMKNTRYVIMQQKAIAGESWILHIIVNRERFFSTIYNRLINILFVIVGMTAVLLVVSVMTLKPLIRIVTEEKRLRYNADKQVRDVVHQRHVIVNTLGEGLVLLNVDNQIQFLNPAAERLINLDTAQANGKDIQEVFQPYIYDAEVDNNVEFNLSTIIDFRLPFKNDNLVFAPENRERFYVSLQCAPITNPQFSGTVMAFNDISKQKEVENTKNNLIATVGHELRTPLASIRGYTELLMSRDFSVEKQKKYLNIIHSVSEHLSRLMDDFLDIRYLDNCKANYHLHPVDLKVLVASVIQHFEDEYKSNSFLFEHPDDLPLLFADAKYLELVFKKLIENAIKFSPDDGKIEVIAKTTQNEIEICVADHGIGISAADQKKLFTPFFRVDNELTRKYEGVGLSLVLVKGIVEAHGGKIIVSSKLDEGSRFIISLPIQMLKTQIPKTPTAPVKMTESA